MRRLPVISAVFVLVLAALGCKRTPSHVIGMDDMARVLADMYVGESVVEMNHAEYYSDSVKQLLKQSILARYGYTQQDFDTSLVWYGHNVDKYIDVCDRTTKILEQRNDALGNAIIMDAVSLSGDSVDVWPGARYARFGGRLPSDLVMFDFKADENADSGDVYTWRVKVLDKDSRSIRWTMLAIYSDSTAEWLSRTTSTRQWNEVTFPTDSTRQLVSLRGAFEVMPRAAIGMQSDDEKDTELWVDSISLIRKRRNPEFYRSRGSLRHSRMF